jgi:hypothetical protein
MVVKREKTSRSTMVVKAPPSQYLGFEPITLWFGRPMGFEPTLLFG